MVNAAHATSDLTESIRTEALRLGFAAIGFARAEPLELEGSRLESWLLHGAHASMEWMRTRSEARKDPRKVLHSARSVISVAMNYFSPETHSTDPAVGKISRYAWGDDYHFVVL